METFLFCFLPAAVELDATGSVSPSDWTEILAGLIFPSELSQSDILCRYLQDWGTIKPETLCIAILKGNRILYFKG